LNGQAFEHSLEPVRVSDLVGIAENLAQVKRLAHALTDRGVHSKNIKIIKIKKMLAQANLYGTVSAS
jgi:hypothetical protein